MYFVNSPKSQYKNGGAHRNMGASKMLYLTAIASIPHKTLFSGYFYSPERDKPQQWAKWKPLCDVSDSSLSNLENVFVQPVKRLLDTAQR